MCPNGRHKLGERVATVRTGNVQYEIISGDLLWIAARRVSGVTENDRVTRNINTEPSWNQSPYIARRRGGPCPLHLSSLLHLNPLTSPVT
ncbi:hypothetical protein AAFF_G00095990 [Aldrovandia affinis]|uniref:Uncharacterized protein n=1 Tax=Aldrovandia affinis TaxID=143900 RepID=A0AAD7WC53_9TELE|nr:hypothetical protein AAFF_G00095990 [Aldrovandia affinis]